MIDVPPATIFAKAIEGSDAYDEQFVALIGLAVTREYRRARNEPRCHLVDRCQ